MKKKICFVLVLFLIFIITGCVSNDTSTFTNQSETTITTIDNEECRIKTASNVDSSYLYNNMTLSAEGINIPVYNCKTNFSHTWNALAPQRMNNAVAILELDGTATFEVVTTFKASTIKAIRPLAKNIEYELTGDYSLEFVVSEAGQYTIEFSNDRTLHLFINEYEAYDEYKTSNNVIYFAPGVHNYSNDTRINSSNIVNIQSNTVVFIDEGAIVEAKFLCNNSSNVTLVGYGIVSGACFDRNANTGTVTVPFEFNYCNNIKFYGISALDPAGWCYNLYFSKNITIDNIKIISSRSNGDGVSLQSCEDVNCTNSFVRSWDDSLVVKNYPRWYNRDLEGTTKNIYFDNCILWTDLAQSMEIGYETVGSVMDNINFTNITVLHNYHKAPISIHNGNNANITNVTYKNIIIEDASMGKGDGTNILFEFTAEFSSTWSNGHKVTSLGSINGVLVENVTVISSNNPEISIRGSHDYRSGYESDHYVTNVTFRNVVISGVKLDSTYENYNTTYSSNIKFE